MCDISRSHVKAAAHFEEWTSHVLRSGPEMGRLVRKQNECAASNLLAGFAPCRASLRKPRGGGVCVCWQRWRWTHPGLLGSRVACARLCLVPFPESSTAEDGDNNPSPGGGVP
eukprot:TRINITY_DN7109_c0_g2_i2.p3 TRINITY_DN7109_c0_g2~~TRINITY_DN7109_c0_g2_i2.p3  ORF type:complete len:113 (-),score=6.10 TRINITY_DN7109_c0_g2_i2:340-678(-)